jgi:diaminohydroxyphosphoribosylaminopyrimidine deaminase/5-amino-6-(5-phosphoribosylamino)uracil reductase
MVGAVIVCDGQVIGEGYHRRAGEGHAEVNAIAAVRRQELLRRSTLYVSLEPCSHYGKTPPCAELLIEKKIPRVVVGCFDPFPTVSGRGIRRLRDAGVEVVTGVLEKEARALNKVFITCHERQRPYIFLKWAQSADGFIDRIRTDASTPPVIFSSPASRRAVHKLRSEVAAVMVGRRTAELDNPALTVRYWSGRQPLRLVLGQPVLPPDAHLSDGSVETLFFSEENLDYALPVLPQVMAELYRRKLDSLLVEGGAALLTSFIKAGLWDEVRIETAPFMLCDGVKAPSLASSPFPYCLYAEELTSSGSRITFYRNAKSLGRGGG